MSHIYHDDFYNLVSLLDIWYCSNIWMMQRIDKWLWCQASSKPWEIPTCISSSLCRGFISLEGKSYVLEPSADHSDGTHWIYTAEHLNFSPGTCGHDFNISHPVEQTDGSPFKAFSTRVRSIEIHATTVNCGCTDSLSYFIFMASSQSWQQRNDRKWEERGGGAERKVF